MQWINQADLRSWADRVGAREEFPVLVRDLVLASAQDVGDIRYMRFPGGESSQIRGHDGDLTMAVGSTYVPIGRSIWEFGTNGDPVKKFKSDYDTRLKGTAAADRAKLTFVFVTPRNWDNYGSWPRSGEIDIMEAINLGHPHTTSDFIQSNVHLCARTNTTYYHFDNIVDPAIQARCGILDVSPVPFAKASKPLPLFFMQNPAGWQPDLVSTFHTYAMEWSPYDMRFYVDNKFIGQVLHGDDGLNRAPFRHGFYLIINLAVGDTGSWPGAADPLTWANDDHADLILDWVRVYMCMPKAITEDCIYNGQGLGERP